MIGTGNYLRRVIISIKQIIVKIIVKHFLWELLKVWNQFLADTQVSRRLIFPLLRNSPPGILQVAFEVTPHPKCSNLDTVS